MGGGGTEVGAYIGGGGAIQFPQLELGAKGAGCKGIEGPQPEGGGSVQFGFGTAIGDPNPPVGALGGALVGGPVAGALLGALDGTLVGGPVGVGGTPGGGPVARALPGGP
jgi:hypothetical protein